MSLETNVILNIYSIVILVTICFHGLKMIEKDSLSDKLYILILYTTIFMLVMDILSRFDGNTSIIYRAFNHIGNFIIFLMSPVLPSLWVAYVHFQVFRDERRIKRVFYPLSIISVINVITLILSQKFGWFYYIDSDNVYHRGPFFLLPAYITIMLMLAAFIIIVVNRRKLGKKRFYSLFFFAVPPFISIIFQIMFYGISFMLNSIVFSLLIVFLNIQDNTVYTDYLTGVNNRKKLDAYLKEKIHLSSREKAFSVILIDINNFKVINDTYGHNIGDNALETAANLLKSCLQTGGLIARYGGDEFCIVLDISNKSELESLVCRINNCVEEHNHSGSSVYNLEFSMGYAVYDYDSHKSAEEFLKHVDMLMYQNKKACKTCKDNFQVTL